jgi:ABC-2 type transport system permease protein
MMIIWLVVSFVIPQLAESQRSFTYNMNVNTQAVTKIATDTPTSNMIEIFSPTVHFEHISYDLLQVNLDSIQLSISEILTQRTGEILYMFVPGILLLIAIFFKFLKEEESN